jgi:peptide-methionine (S)-S-oxide reductase
MVANKNLIVGGGCFWCLEAIFERLRGVDSVVSGYANGDMINPDYRSVCSGDTGHAEVVQIDYDDSIISLDDLLGIFFDIHDPTTINRQGADIGTQYRSVILYEDKLTKDRAILARESAQQYYNNEIVTIIEPLDKFYLAENYHQDYYRLNMLQGYCKVVISPKVNRLIERYPNKID